MFVQLITYDLCSSEESQLQLIPFFYVHKKNKKTRIEKRQPLFQIDVTHTREIERERE